MPIEQQPPVPILPQSEQRKFGVVLIVFVGIVIVFSFITGFAVSSLIQQEYKHDIQQNQSPTPTVSVSDPITPQPLPGTQYYDDTIIFITKTAPHKAMLASQTRKGSAHAFVQDTRISFFNGQEWTRSVGSHMNSLSTIQNNEHIKKWDLFIDPSRVLKEKITASLEVNGVTIDVESNTLLNEMSMRSLPGYTKFMSQGTAKVRINSQPEEAYILYTKIYSMDASEIQFYNSPMDLTTDWIAFWDKEGAFYHIDRTDVKTPTPIYETHQIGIGITNDGWVGKTFAVDVTRDSVELPTTATYTLKSPLNAVLTVKRNNLLDKEPGNAYSWIAGTLSGEVLFDGKKTTGIGIIEYIHH